MKTVIIFAFLMLAGGLVGGSSSQYTTKKTATPAKYENLVKELPAAKTTIQQGKEMDKFIIALSELDNQLDSVNSKLDSIDMSLTDKKTLRKVKREFKREQRELVNN